MTPRDTRRTTLTSAASMRVLAHPTRLRLLGLLRELGPQTAAQLGDIVDEAPGTISYHLGKLASIALIEPAEAQSSDQREHWWQATTALTSWEPADLLDDPDQLAASASLQKSIAQAYAARYTDYIDATPNLPRDWVGAAASGDRSLRLTVEELTAMRAELEALVDRWVETGAAHDPAGSDGAEPVVLVYQAYRRP
ncbi:MULTISPECIES: helix-turn-helix domain-containing protein [Cryobacterium]|uniref:ArsR family transcriptional regulator n=1 Tax=Cryobacterium zongtaii TaxID=1259217 RepID=A0A2S3ZAJ6_9MICO|nr:MULTISPECIES: helix-turn-helix domain-containing protein [Cryobacterium]POH62574.1 ArsR family transcriptional regulator [Cryobacterium zongtaii]POH69975.1 ArsR family transcriptional regulator [Cryobacterium zongtaii]TFC42986.1 ArsR family transcriptional regulator [Cryobacterium sp. TMN-39-2]TFC50363.1 ArsR family transcriptional regulator [Cryobacterium sp. TMB3-1-2]TFC60805.1 ArsR family transcriptional regulator [Cryobacterium sp. TMB1-7]